MSCYRESDDDAEQVFLEMRSSQVLEQLYDDTEQCFRWLRSHGVRTIGIMTNGGIDLGVCAPLLQHVDFVLQAADVGAQKPRAAPFFATAARCGHPMDHSRVLFVGDSYEKDVIGAHNFGFRTALLLRPDLTEDQQSASQYSITNSLHGRVDAEDVDVADKYSVADFVLSSLSHDELKRMWATASQ